MAPFLIDATSLTEFQTCRRKFIFSRQWRATRWIPKMLLDSCLRQGIYELSKGKSIEDVRIEATTRLFATGANPGLDIPGHNPYTIAQDLAAILETVLTALSKKSLPPMTPIESKAINDNLEWVFLAYEDDKGNLHRYVTVDRFDDNRLSQEMHSWYVFGDVCMSRKPMFLHFIEIGQLRDGRRHTPWARAYQHEYIANRIKFQRKGNKKLQGEAWKAVFLADSSVLNADSWVESMEADGVIDTLIHDCEVNIPSMDHIQNCRRDIKTEATQMQEWIRSIQNPHRVPMSRHACDMPYPCAFQPACYSPIIDVDIRSLGIYKPRIGA